MKKIKTISLPLLILTAICVSLSIAHTDYTADTITDIDVILEDWDQDIKNISLTKDDSLTIQLTIPTSDIDISIKNGTQVLKNWHNIDSSFTLAIAFTAEGTFTVILENTGIISGGDSIHITGSYTITTGGADQAELTLGDLPLAEPLNPFVGFLIIIGIISVPIIYIVSKRSYIKNTYQAPSYELAKAVKAAGATPGQYECGPGQLRPRRRPVAQEGGACICRWW